MTEYFDSYMDPNVHRLMLKDAPRVEAYKRALEACKGRIENGVVVDVGSGTGFLAILAATLGAKVVVAIEASEMAGVITSVARENGVEDRVLVFAGNADDYGITMHLELEPKPRLVRGPAQTKDVDVVVSEWMGFHLLHESMLDTVISLRKRLLKPDGLMLPSSAKVWSALVDAQEYIDQEVTWCHNVGGVSMSCLDPLFRSTIPNPLVHQFDWKNVSFNTPLQLAELDLTTIEIEDLEVISEEVTYRVHQPSQSGLAHGVLIWFEVGFPDSVSLSTSPSAHPTHWKQSMP
ncbi:MAG: uncharacterized protein KVP18_005234 [Porospora cf. gigantea A]|uniref:uncharacterized protein n=1 Tax=Porospora cf. gigantea A TaxID=2853593 RepID=UPI00355AB781|nr:MAG: hypothetical protein KVP18_005234 [Porospora cf. gigantea A]